MLKPLTIISLLLCSSLTCQADDSGIIKQLESLGGKGTRKDGVITELMFRDSSKLGDAHWKLIGRLETLKKLTAYGGARGLNDETVGYMASLKQLESLATDGAQLSDAGLAKLAALTNLRSASFFHLSFRKDGFTGKGFAAWKSLTKLERLTVAGMSMGDEGFEAIAQLRSLHELRTWHTYRTQASNAEIAKLPNLRSLKLGQRLPRGKGTPLSLSDDTIPILAEVRTLESLEIGEARFSLEALRQLRALPKLRRLKIDRTELTASDIERLRTEMPKVQIHFEPLTDEQRKKLENYLR